MNPALPSLLTPVADLILSVTTVSLCLGKVGHSKAANGPPRLRNYRARAPPGMAARRPFRSPRQIVKLIAAIELQKRVERFAAQPLSDGLIHEIDSFSTDEHIDGSVNRHEFLIYMLTHMGKVSLSEIEEVAYAGSGGQGRIWWVGFNLGPRV